MKDPLGVSPSKGNQGTTRGKEKFLLTSVGIEPTTCGFDPTTCRFDPHRGQKKFFFTSCGSLIPFTRANASINSSGAHPPPGNRGTFAHVVSPGGGAFALLSLPRGLGVSIPRGI